MLTADQLRERLISSCLARPDEIVGCTEREIVALEKEIGHRFPESYRSFLRVAGKRVGNFLDDLTIFYPKIVGLTDRLRKHFEGILELPPDAFVFMNRMGEIFMFFELGCDDDAPFSQWSEETDRIEKAGFFWDFLEDELREAEKSFGFRKS